MAALLCFLISLNGMGHYFAFSTQSLPACCSSVLLFHVLLLVPLDPLEKPSAHPELKSSAARTQCPPEALKLQFA